MGLNVVSAGKDLPNDFNVIIEIPAHSEPIKYEVDKETGALFVDRFLGTSMHYPCDYGYIPKTLSDDGDPVDVLIITPFPVSRGSVIRCRAIGMLLMTDESGEDAKVLAVPIKKLTPQYNHIESFKDVDPFLIRQIEHFFTHYKDLEEGKWVTLKDWQGPKEACDEILESVRRFETSPDQPAY